MTNYSKKEITEYIDLLEKYSPLEGVNTTAVEGLFTFRASEPHQRRPVVYEPAIIIGGQRSKCCYLDGKKYDYSAGNYLVLFLTMPIEIEILEATSQRPLLAAAIRIDLHRLASLLVRIDQAEQVNAKPLLPNVSGIYSAPLNGKMLGAAVRLLQSLGSPSETAVLSESIVDELYYRILCEEVGGSLRHLLHQRGQIQQISKAVEYIQQNLEEVISIEILAEVVNMSSSVFHRKFKEVMHMSPLQYAKSIKLSKAQDFITEGKSVSEAGYLVGYNSPAQFSREYKRYFGVAPSLVKAG